MSRSGLKIPLSVNLSFVLISSLAFAAEKLDPAGENALLQQLDAKRERGGGGMQAAFTETKNSRLLQKPLVTEGTMAFQSPDKFRREVAGANRSLTVSDGETLWIYYPNFNEVEVYSSGRNSFFDDSISALTAGLSYTKLPEVYAVEAWREEAGFRLELTPKRRNLKRILEKMTLWIDRDLNPARTEVSLPKNDRLVTTYRSVQRRSLPDSMFEFTPPSGATISHPMGK